MSAGAWVLIGAAVAMGASALLLAYRAVAIAVHMKALQERTTPQINIEPGSEVKVETDRRLTDPPTWDGVTLYTWLVHHHPLKIDAWASIVAEFYHRAERDPMIAAYFEDVDLEKLQRHFTHALIIVTKSGVTTRTLEMLGEKHTHIQTREGQPITSEVYDEVIGTLAAIMIEQGVPRAAVARLAASIEPIKAVIVR